MSPGKIFFSCFCEGTVVSAARNAASFNTIIEDEAGAANASEQQKSNNVIHIVNFARNWLFIVRSLKRYQSL